MKRAGWLGLALALCSSGLGDGQGSAGQGLLSHAMPSTQAVLQTPFCRTYGCVYAGSVQVGGLQQGVPDTDERFTLRLPGQPARLTGLLGVTHDAQRQVTSMYVRLKPVKLMATPLLALGQRFASLALGAKGAVGPQAVRTCLQALTAEAAIQPTGGLADLGQGQQAEILSCSYLPAQDRLFDLSFSADAPGKP